MYRERIQRLSPFIQGSQSLVIQELYTYYLGKNLGIKCNFLSLLEKTNFTIDFTANYEDKYVWNKKEH